MELFFEFSYMHNEFKDRLTLLLCKRIVASLLVLMTFAYKEFFKGNLL